jgi:hypothetical protein
MSEERKADRVAEEWPVGWETHREAQLDRWLSATPAQRLAWLEEMIALAWKTGALPRKEGR